MGIEVGEIKAEGRRIGPRSLQASGVASGVGKEDFPSSPASRAFLLTLGPGRGPLDGTQGKDEGRW